jgi:hypothetical protein
MVDEGAFDNLVRGLAASVQSRRSLAMAAVGLGLSILAPFAGETEAARRRQDGRKKRRKSGKGNRGASGKGSGGGKKPHGGHEGDCGSSETCPVDPQTGKPGTLCRDGQCTCGGNCCEKGFACFVEKTTPGKEVCCYIDEDQSSLPEKVQLVACPGEFFDPNVCCDRNLCQVDGTCSGLTLGRYRRNPR